MMQTANHWKGLVLGVAGSVAGLAAMGKYFALVPMPQGSAGQDDYAGFHALDSLSLVGKQARDDEGSTAAVGRIAYQAVTGEEPQSQETRTTLSYQVHWAYGMGMGGLYGLVRPAAGWPDLGGGLAFGTGLWALGSQIIVPMLGLAKGPTAYPPRQHLVELGGHLVYGLVTSATTQLLNRVLP